MSAGHETVLQILTAATAWLDARGVDAPRRSMELLMGHVLGLDRLKLYLAHDRPVSPDERTRLRELVARRGRHEPVAHLLGTWEFYGHELEVGPDVLVPRPETEGLVDLALARLPMDACRVVDLGTGSGAIAIAIALARPSAEIVAIERTFPELKLPTRRTVVRAATQVTKRTRRMSAAARKAVSARMKRYWAERRKAQAKVK